MLSKFEYERRSFNAHTEMLEILNGLIADIVECSNDNQISKKDSKLIVESTLYALKDLYTKIHTFLNKSPGNTVKIAAEMSLPKEDITFLLSNVEGMICAYEEIEPTLTKSEPFDSLFLRIKSLYLNNEDFIKTSSHQFESDSFIVMESQIYSLLFTKFYMRILILPSLNIKSFLF